MTDARSKMGAQGKGSSVACGLASRPRRFSGRYGQGMSKTL